MSALVKEWYELYELVLCCICSQDCISNSVKTLELYSRCCMSQNEKKRV